MPAQFHHWKNTIYILAGAFLLTIFFAGPTFFYPVYYDQATFMYVARIWQDGLLPFKDAVDTKPIGIFALYGLADLLFGRQEYSYRILEFFCIISTVLPFRYIFKSTGMGPKWGNVSYLIYIVIYYLGTSFTNIGQVEMVIANISIWFLAFCIRVYDTNHLNYWTTFLAGCITGILFLLKQPFASLGILYLMLIYLRSETKRCTILLYNNYKLLLAFSAGTFFVFSVVFVYFAVHQAAYDLFYGMLKLPLLYSKYSNLPSKTISDYTSLLAWNLPLFFIFGYATVKMFLSGQVNEKLILIWSCSLLFGITIQFKFWPYHLIAILPVIAIFLSYGIYNIIQFFELYAGPKTAGFWVALVLALEACALGFEMYRPNTYGIGSSNSWVGAVSNTWKYTCGKLDKTHYYATYYGTSTRLDTDWLFAKKILQYTKNNQSLQIVEFRPSLYIYTHQHAPHKYFFGSLVFLVGPKEGERIFRNYEVLTYTSKRPDWIVFGLDGPWKAKRILALHPAQHGYELVDTFVSTYHPNNKIKKVTFGIFKTQKTSNKNI